MHASLARSASKATALHAVTSANVKRFLAASKRRASLAAAGFAGREGELAPLVVGGHVAAWALGLGEAADPFALAAFAEKLPDGVYCLGEVPPACAGPRGVLAWLLGRYGFERYKSIKRRAARLVVPAGVDAEEITRIAEAVFVARDLINTPANDLGPEELAAAARVLADRHGAKISVIQGAALAKNFPLVEAVGRGSIRPPRFVDLRWGPKGAPKVTLVGKGVCFDSGGYDLKPSSAMLTMKKDMGGAASVLAAMAMAMGAKLAIDLRVIIPAVENSVSGAAFRPGDVFRSRKGLSVEIGNTDAEGRLVLADALALADEDAPDLLIDIATLTGAARAATGMELPPFFTDDESLAADLLRLGAEQNDPLWRLPLWRGYEFSLAGRVADLNNNPAYGYAGAITAALFLNRFVSRAKSWVHLDIPAWNDRARPGRPIGGEANGARAVYSLLRERYGR